MDGGGTETTQRTTVCLIGLFTPFSRSLLLASTPFFKYFFKCLFVCVVDVVRGGLKPSSSLVTHRRAEDMFSVSDFPRDRDLVVVLAPDFGVSGHFAE